MYLTAGNEGLRNTPPTNMTVGVQDVCPPNMLLWYTGYLGPYALEKQKMQGEAFFELPLSA